MRYLAALLTFILLSSPALGAASRSFDGTGDVIDMGNTNDIGSTDATYGLWINMTEDASADALLGKKNSATNDAGYKIDQGSTDLPLVRNADGTDTVVSNGTTDTDGAWRFVTATWSTGTQTTRILVNNTQEDTDTNAAVGSLSNAVDFQLGQSADSLNDANGLMAYAFVHTSRILTAQELEEIRWKPDMMELMSGFWPLWGDSPEIDLSASANTGTVTNATTSASGPPVMIGVGGAL